METRPLDFERPILELERRIQELESFSKDRSVNLSDEISTLRDRLGRLKGEIFSRLTPWQRVQLSRHQNRPQTADYVRTVLDDFIELHGDRYFGDDAAMLAGFASIGDLRFMLIGQRKGKSTRERLKCNFGMPHPEGYRKALRKMQLAERFHLPVVTLIDTPGAYPGIEAEERGQAHAIAENLLAMAMLRTPILSIVIGEGGSGGAIGLGLADRLCILEHAYYSVISPEGCAAILWRSAESAPQAAEALRLTAQDLLKLGVADEVLKEPLGGAHADPKATADTMRAAIVRHLAELSRIPVAELRRKRYEKYRSIGAVRMPEN